MTRFEVNAETLSSFFSKINLDEFNIKVCKEGWFVEGIDRENLSAVFGILKKNAFFTYPTIEEEKLIGIESKEKFLKFLERFDDKISIEVKEKVLYIISLNRQLEMILPHESILVKTKQPNLTYQGNFTIKSEVFKQAVKNNQLLESSKYILQITEGELSIVSTNNVDKIIEIAKINYPNCKGVFGDKIREVFTPLSGDVKISLSTNYPLLIEYEDKVSELKYVIAPIVEEENYGKDNAVGGEVPA